MKVKLFPDCLPTDCSGDLIADIKLQIGKWMSFNDDRKPTKNPDGSFTIEIENGTLDDITKLNKLGYRIEAL